MKYVGPTRREIGIRTVFNILGPLTNPAHTRYQVLGVADSTLLRKMGLVLLRMGCQHALIIHGEDGIDECSLSAPTRICEVHHGQELREYTITPEDVGLTRVTGRQAFQGGDPAHNAAMLRTMLKNIRQPQSISCGSNQRERALGKSTGLVFSEGLSTALRSRKGKQNRNYKTLSPVLAL
jgi:anthranilate phosphoribosyltransferase